LLVPEVRLLAVSIAKARRQPLITIGIDPHKRTHTAVVIDEHRRKIGGLAVVASPAMTRTLLRWASAWPTRGWAVEGSDGLGRLLAQQLVAAGETVVEVPPTLAARARLLRTGHGRKTDGIDALSVAEIAAARHDLRQVVTDGNTTVLRLLADRRDELSQQRRQAVNRLHRHLRDLVPGGAPTSLTAETAAKLLSRLRPTDTVTIERKHIARQLVAEIRRLGTDLKDNRQRTREAVEACGTTLVDVFGISHVLAAKILGHTGPIGRFANANAFASYTGTAPIEVSSGDAVRHRLSRAGNRQLNNALHLVAHVQRIHSGPGRDYYRRKIAQGKSPKEAMRCLKRQLAKIVYRRLRNDDYNAEHSLHAAA
jgi:transposase